MIHVSRFALFSVLSVLSVADCFAAQQAWVQKYSNGPNTTNQAVAMALDKDGNIYVAGNSTRTNAPYDFDYVLIKYNSLGAQQWVSRYGLAGVNDQVRAMVANTNGEVFITGTTETLSYLPNGSLLWNRSYAGRGIATDTNGNCYITGFLTNDFSTVKLDAFGSNVWLRTWDYRQQEDVSRAVAVDGIGNVFVGGIGTYLCDRGGCYRQPWILKYDKEGTLLWNVASSGPDNSFFSEFEGFACGADDQLYIAATYQGYFTRDPWSVVKINSDGEFIWGDDLDSHNFSEGVKSMALVGEAVYYTGSLNGHVYQTYKLTRDGTNLWANQYAGPAAGYHRAYGVAADESGCAYITGASTGIGTGNDYATIKYGTNGQELWVKRYTEAGNSDDQAVAIALSQSGDVYVTGFSNPTNGLYEITTIKYVQIAPIEKKSNGSVLLQFCGAPGSNYVIQATTNFPNWSTIGNSTADSTGLYRFEDTNAPAYPSRFYRVEP